VFEAGVLTVVDIENVFFGVLRHFVMNEAAVPVLDETKESCPWVPLFSVPLEDFSNAPIGVAPAPNALLDFEH
jgi:hypothetical protein